MIKMRVSESCLRFHSWCLNADKCERDGPAARPLSHVLDVSILTRSP